MTRTAKTPLPPTHPLVATKGGRLTASHHEKQHDLLTVLPWLHPNLTPCCIVESANCPELNLHDGLSDHCVMLLHMMIV